MKSILATTLVLFSFFPLFSQLNGTVKDNENNLLPYVNIYVKNTSLGTTTNVEGAYILKLEPGQYEVSFQYVGFRTITKEISLTNEATILDIVLEPEDYKLAEIVISANAEDPAYAIIRKAQAQRKYYKNLGSNFECDAYVRGFNKVLDAPEKILGFEVGDMEGMLDSTRQGVVYLSESVSKLYQKDGKSKEVMFSSKVSGDDQGYSFNSAQEMDFNFYDNTVDLNKQIVTPIANGAMSYYKYKLEGAKIDENGQLVNKIKVDPKNENTPGFYGYIYINEDLWNIHSLELGVTSKATQLPFVDSLVFKQIFVPQENDRWVKLSNVIRFKMSAMGFSLAGNFGCVYSNYILDQVDDKVFGHEVFRVEREANERSEAYWLDVRPIPLTNEERIDYIRKDSIRIVKESPEYLDSIDRENNEFKLFDILTGYSYQNSQKRSNLSYNSPIGDISFNTIQGWNTSLGLSFRKAFNKKRTKRLGASFNLNYGFSEKVWRPKINIDYLSNRYNNLRFILKAGRDIEQYNRIGPISNTVNAFWTLVFDQNYLKAFDKKFVNLQVSRDLGNVFRGQISLAYQDRSALINNHICEEPSITSNDPLQPLNYGQAAFDDHQALILRASLRIKIGEKVWNYPDRKFKVGSSWPSLWLHYKKGINALGSDVGYDLVYGSLYKNYIIGTAGHSDILFKAGHFLNNEEMPFIDHYHFIGTETHFANPEEYYNRFLMLPYYSNSTDGSFVEFHYQHNFQGLFLSKVPGFKQLGWHLAGGYKYLNTSDRGAYQEFHIGLDNIGYKIFRVFRVDAVWSNQAVSENEPSQGLEFGVILGMKIGI